MHTVKRFNVGCREFGISINNIRTALEMLIIYYSPDLKAPCNNQSNDGISSVSLSCECCYVMQLLNVHRKIGHNWDFGLGLHVFRGCGGSEGSRRSAGGDPILFSRG